MPPLNVPESPAYNPNPNPNHTNSTLLTLTPFQHLAITIYRGGREEEGAPVHDDELDVGVLAVLVQEVGHKVGDGLVGDVTTQHDVPVHHTSQL